MHAEWILETLEKFPGYTYRTLMEEDEEIIRLMNVRERGRTGV